MKLCLGFSVHRGLGGGLGSNGEMDAFDENFDSEDRKMNGR